MNCAQTKHQLSGYLDDALDWRRMLELGSHLTSCRECAREAEQLKALRRLVRAQGRVAPPPGLALEIKVALSRRQHLRFWERLGVRVDNFFRPLAIPATAGLLTALLTFGVLIHTFALRTAALAEDVPLNLATPPKLRATAPITFNTGENGLLVEMRVDGQGRITDFRILEGPQDARAVSELRRVLVFAEFDPATYFGKPTAGRTLMNFRRVSVKG